MSDELEKIAAAVDVVASRYAERHNDASGTEQMIYGELCDALRELSEEIRRKIKQC